MSVKNFQKESFGRVTRWYAHFFASVPFLLTCAVFLTVICWKSPVLLLCLLFIGLATTVIQQIAQQTHLSRHWLILLQTLAIATILSFFWIDYFSVPAAAQFFGKAENFFKNNLTQGSSQGSGTANAVSLVFNVIRALYLLYIAVALIGVVNAVRKDEDWQVVARTPLLVVIAVTIADVLTSFIIG
ncbi:hypothetical protein [Scytonema sp. NUACC26]|uniref:hypothetical protein n=1 Tax=Scytonema sp. NUACC26 TaxID=3140176 RepID=UPI0034DC8F58